jgi:hypothetical protein
VYVAENLRKLAPAGKRVDSGQRIATAIPGYPYIETGWANEDGSTLAVVGRQQSEAIGGS